MPSHPNKPSSHPASVLRVQLDSVRVEVNGDIHRKDTVVVDVLTNAVETGHDRAAGIAVVRRCSKALLGTPPPKKTKRRCLSPSDSKSRLHLEVLTYRGGKFFCGTLAEIDCELRVRIVTARAIRVVVNVALVPTHLPDGKFC
jgi:hypothetical protein